ncbi:hypothetical protein FB451DRAFT_1389376 [Mycena latifolia]|nr:hypothetical protein FB451DRAFT_1389376 [Mycena latifolia]
MNTSQAQLMVSTLLGISALIPSAPLRYTVLGITIFLAVIYGIYLKHPSIKLGQLQKIIETIEATIRSAKLLCPRDHIALTEEWLTVEAERQWKLTEEIREAQFILATGMSIHFNWDLTLTHSPVQCLKLS